MVAVDVAVTETASIAVDQIRERAGILVVAFPAPTTGSLGAVVFHLHAPKRSFHARLIDDIAHHVQTIGMGVVHLDIPNGSHGAEANGRFRGNGGDPADERAVGIAAPAGEPGGKTQDQFAVHVERERF